MTAQYKKMKGTGLSFSYINIEIFLLHLYTIFNGFHNIDLVSRCYNI